MLEAFRRNDLNNKDNKMDNKELRKIAKDNIEYAIIQCGGNTKYLNLEALLNRLGFGDNNDK